MALIGIISWVNVTLEEIQSNQNTIDRNKEDTPHSMIAQLDQ